MIQVAYSLEKVGSTMIKPGAYDLDKILELRKEINNISEKLCAEDLSIETSHVRGMKLMHKYGMVSEEETFPDSYSYKEYEFEFFNRRIKELFITFCGTHCLRTYSGGAFESILSFSSILNVKVRASEKLYEEILKPHYDYLSSHPDNDYLNKDYETLLSILPNLDCPVEEAILAKYVGMQKEDVESLMDKLVDKGALVRTPVLYHYKANRGYDWDRKIKYILEDLLKKEEEVEGFWKKLFRYMKWWRDPSKW